MRLGDARDLRLSPRTKTLGPLAPGARRTYRVKARFGPRSATINDVSLRASAGGLVADTKVRMVVRHPRRPSSGGGGGGSGTQVCTRWSPDLSGQTGGSLILVPC